MKPKYTQAFGQWHPNYSFQLSKRRRD